MNLRKMFLCHFYEVDNLTCGKDLMFMEHAQLKDIIFSISIVVSSYMEIYLFVWKAKAWTTVTLIMYLILWVWRICYFRIM
jgi:hypothetical protein